MATYEDLGAAIQLIGAVQIDPDGWRLEVSGAGGPEGGRSQKIFLWREVVPGGPGFEVIKIDSPVVLLGSIDPAAVLRKFGQLTIGLFGFTPLEFGDGWVTLGTSIPLVTLDLRDPQPFLVYLHILGQAADNLEHQLTGFDWL